MWSAGWRADRDLSRPPGAASLPAMFRWPGPAGVWRASWPVPSSEAVNPQGSVLRLKTDARPRRLGARGPSPERGMGVRH